MDFLQLMVLAIIQGVTEFLPVSSSGHLILPSALLGWSDQGLAFDVAVHFGSLLAVLLYFRRDIGAMVVAWFASLRGQQSDDGRLAWWVIVATIPAVVAGLILNDFIEENLRNAWVLGSTTLIFGILLGFAQRFSVSARQCRDLTLAMVLIIGFAQAVALIPGTSRSGITITAAAFLGLSLVEASRFSFLLSVPVITGAALLKTVELLGADTAVDWMTLIVAAGLSGVTAFLCIGLFMRWVERIGLMPFAVYRVVLAALIFAVASQQI